jgi:hypothetical protein
VKVCNKNEGDMAADDVTILLEKDEKVAIH